MGHGAWRMVWLARVSWAISMDNELLNKLKQYRIAVLAGGPSSERDISLKSGQAVFNALKASGLDVDLIDIKDDTFAFIEKHEFDMAFIALHGRFGEDGTVQKRLEEINKNYTGSGPLSSRAALDKVVTKEKLTDAGIRVPEYFVLKNKGEYVEGNIGYPCVVKPRYEGSSIGLSVVPSRDKIEEAIEEAFRYDESIIVEKYIKGREITVGILEGKALSLVEIVTLDGVYDYNAKYSDAKTKYIVPAEINDDVANKIKETGLKAHSVLGCSSFSRVDMRLSADGEVYVLEVNTIPGLTGRSLLPLAAGNDGIDFPELCIKILGSAFDDMEKS